MTTGSGRLQPAILIISDTAFKDTATDKAGDILRETLRSEGGEKWGEPFVEIVPDDAERIELAIRKWTDDGIAYVNLIVTTGGTGFAVQDMTPEVGCRRCIDSEHFGILSTTWLTREVGYQPAHPSFSSGLGVSSSLPIKDIMLREAYQARHAGSLSPDHTM